MTGERCRLCSKLVAAKERRVLKGESSAPGEVLSCLLALLLSSGGTVDAADLIPSDSPQSFLCKCCFSEVERYLRLSNQVNILNYCFLLVIAKTGIPKPVCYLNQSCLYFAHLVRLDNSLLYQKQTA